MLQSEAPALHVYEHVVPLHIGLDPFVDLQTSPHALQLVSVSSVVQVPVHAVSRQVHDPLRQSGVGCAQLTVGPQLPPGLQSSVPLPLHRLVPGAQATHVLFEQAGAAIVEHIAVVCQVPVASHD